MKKIGILLGVAIISLAIIISANNNNNTNSDSYIYKVTEVNGDEIRGVAITNKGDDNEGIFLYGNEYKVHVGDKVSVVWGKNNKILKVENVH